jgi:simple sugar transport system substrate-binding protein
MKRLGKALAGAAMTLAVVAGSAPAHATRIVVITHGQASDTFWSVVKHGVDDAAKLMGVEVQYQAPQTFDMVAMAQLIDAAVASKPDGLVVSIPDAEALGDSIRAAVAAGIPVISMDSGLDVSKQLGALLHLGIDEYPSGLAAGEKMKARGKKSGACVNMEVGNVALDQRCQGFADALDGNSQVIATSNDPTEIRAGVTGYLKQHPEIDAVLTAGATAFDPTLAAVEEAGLGDQISLGSFDLSPTMLQAIDEGRALFGIDAQQYLTGTMPYLS